LTITPFNETAVALFVEAQIGKYAGVPLHLISAVADSTEDVLDESLTIVANKLLII